MKKQFSILLILSIILSLSACVTSPEVITAKFTATILELGENHALVMPVAGEDILRSSDKISFSLSSLDNIGAQVGDIIQVVYSGEVMESYPAQIFAQSWSLIKKAEPENSLLTKDLTDDNIYLNTTAEYSYNDVLLRVKLPVDWNYSITSAQESMSPGGEYEKFGITFWPEEAPELSVEFFYHPHLVGICGTGVTSTEIELSNGLKGIKNTEQIGGNYWLHLSLYEPYLHYYIDSSSPVDIWCSYESVIYEIFNTIEVGGDL